MDDQGSVWCLGLITKVGETQTPRTLVHIGRLRKIINNRLPRWLNLWNYVPAQTIMFMPPLIILHLVKTRRRNQRLYNTSLNLIERMGW